MSWQAYVDEKLVGSGQFDQAAIFDAAGSSVWATSAGFAVTPAELSAFAKAFQSADALTQLYGSGVDIAGQHYVTIKAEDRSIYGKKGRAGVMIVKTKQAMLVAHHPETVISGNAANVIEQLADYLVSSNY